MLFDLFLGSLCSLNELMFVKSFFGCKVLVLELLECFRDWVAVRRWFR